MTKKYKVKLFLIIDIILINFSLILTYLLSLGIKNYYGTTLELIDLLKYNFIAITMMKILLFFAFRYYKILPEMYKTISRKIDIYNVRDVAISDLLGREQVELNSGEIEGFIKGKKVLVTGGGGSIGSELCRQIIMYNPVELSVLDINENSVYDLKYELEKKIKDKNQTTYNFKTKLNVIIASIRDEVRMNEIIEKHKPNVIFHAAAHKHVPLMENNPKEAIKNNVFGTLNVINAAHKNNVKRFVLISTDKAVNPINIMGASKRISEMISQSINEISNTEFVSVRFGNVLGTKGSVIPSFKKQIADGGPVTVTHPKVTRYFMTIQESTQLVMQAGAIAKGGEVFVLDMGEPVKILDLAEGLIRLSGMEPYKDIEIKFIGLRKGEKLTEELLLDKKHIEYTDHHKILIEKPLFKDFNTLKENLEELYFIVINGSEKEVYEYVKKLVPEFKTEEN